MHKQRDIGLYGVSCRIHYLLHHGIGIFHAANISIVFYTDINCTSARVGKGDDLFLDVLHIDGLQFYRLTFGKQHSNLRAKSLSFQCIVYHILFIASSHMNKLVNNKLNKFLL